MILVTDVDHAMYSGVISPVDAKTTYTKDTLIASLKGDESTDKDDIKLSTISPNPDVTSEFYDLVTDTGGSMLMSGID